MRCAVFFLALALPWSLAADNSRLALGVAATLDHQLSSQTGSADHVTTTDTVGVMFGFPLGDAWRSSVTLSVTEQSAKDATNDYWQVGMVGGLGLSYPIASTGPFAVRAGASATLGFLGPPSQGSGSYSNVFGTISLPLAASAAMSRDWVIQVSQPVVMASGKWVKAGGVNTSTSFVRLNTGLSPTVAVLYNF